MSQGAEPILQDGEIYIRPRRNESSAFSEEILADLVAQGLSGQELLALFKERKKKVRPAVQKMIDEADEAVKSGAGKRSIDDMFGSGKSSSSSHPDSLSRVNMCRQ